MLFTMGVSCAVLFGSVLAAYDLWGGVPRSLWRLMRGLLVVGGTAIIAGAIGWVRTYPAGQRLRAAFKGVVALAVLAALMGGALFAHYASRWDTSRDICQPARSAPTLEERQAALAKGLGPLFPVIDPHSECLRLKEEVDELERDGVCPPVIIPTIPCRCGQQRYEPDGESPCPDGTVTCQWRAEARTTKLGCAEGEMLEGL